MIRLRPTHMMTRAEPDLQRQVKREQPLMLRETLRRAEPTLMKAAGGAADDTFGLTADQLTQGIQAALKAGNRDMATRLGAALKQLNAQSVDPAADLEQGEAGAAIRGLSNTPFTGMAGNIESTFPAVRNWVGGTLFPMLGLPGATPEQLDKAAQAIGNKFPQFPLPHPGTNTYFPTSSDIIDAADAAFPGVKDLAQYQPKTPLAQNLAAPTELALGVAGSGQANTVKGILGAMTKYGVIPGEAGNLAANVAPPGQKDLARTVAELGAGVAAGAGSNLVRAPGAAARGATEFNPADASAATNAARAASPAVNAKMSIVDQALSQQIRNGTLDKQGAQAAFSDLDRALNLPANRGNALFTPEERAFINRMAAGNDPSLIVKTAEGLTGWRSLIGSLGTGVSAYLLSSALHIPFEESAPAIVASGVASAGIGKMARDAAAISQSRDMTNLAQQMTGQPLSRAATMNPVTAGNMTLAPSPSDVDRYQQ